MAGDLLKTPVSKFFGITFLSRKVMVLVMVLIFSGVAFAHTAMNKFWGEVPVDMLLTGDVLIMKPLVVPEGVYPDYRPGHHSAFRENSQR